MAKFEAFAEEQRIGFFDDRREEVRNEVFAQLCWIVLIVVLYGFCVATVVGSVRVDGPFLQFVYRSLCAVAFSGLALCFLSIWYTRSIEKIDRVEGDLSSA